PGGAGRARTAPGAGRQPVAGTAAAGREAPGRPRRPTPARPAARGAGRRGPGANRSAGRSATARRTGPRRPGRPADPGGQCEPRAIEVGCPRPFGAPMTFGFSAPDEILRPDGPDGTMAHRAGETRRRRMMRRLAELALATG